MGCDCGETGAAGIVVGTAGMARLGDARGEFVRLFPAGGTEGRKSGVGAGDSLKGAARLSPGAEAGVCGTLDGAKLGVGAGAPARGWPPAGSVTTVAGAGVAGRARKIETGFVANPGLDGASMIVVPVRLVLVLKDGEAPAGSTITGEDAAGKESAELVLLMEELGN